jgi:hypothetical protein
VSRQNQVVIAGLDCVQSLDFARIYWMFQIFSHFYALDRGAASLDGRSNDGDYVGRAAADSLRLQVSHVDK